MDLVNTDVIWVDFHVHIVQQHLRIRPIELVVEPIIIVYQTGQPSFFLGVNPGLFLHPVLKPYQPGNILPLQLILELKPFLLGEILVVLPQQFLCDLLLPCPLLIGFP